MTNVTEAPARTGKRQKRKGYSKTSSSKSTKCSIQNSAYHFKIFLLPPYQVNGKSVIVRCTDLNRDEEKSVKWLEGVIRRNYKGRLRYVNLFDNKGKLVTRYDSQMTPISQEQFDNLLAQKKKSNGYPQPLYKMQYRLTTNAILNIRHFRMEALTQNGYNLPSNILQMDDRKFEQTTYRQIKGLVNPKVPFNPIAKLRINAIKNSFDERDGKPSLVQGFLHCFNLYSAALNHAVTHDMIQGASLYLQDYPNKSSKCVATFDYKGSVKFKDNTFKTQLKVLDKKGEIYFP